MHNEREYLAKLESANTEELARMVAAPTAEEEEVLRTYLGDACFQRMHRLALRSAGGAERGLSEWFGGKRSALETWGNVVVLPGLMGSELTSRNLSGDDDRIWLHIPRIVIGRLSRLRMADDGLNESDPRYRVRPTGILKRYYGELMLSLARRWETKAFWYDWRKDLNIAADALLASINRWFGPDQPVHLVAHSMGGLVARTFIKRHSERWASMWDRGGAGRPPGMRGGRLVMLGTPNHGSYLIPQAATGLAETIKLIQRLDQWHGLDDLLRITNSFPGPFQMLPSPWVDRSAGPLYKPATYGNRSISTRVLEQAEQQHAFLKDVIDTDRMLYIAGSDQPTYDGITDIRRIGDLDAYKVTNRGDGSVSHRLGLLKDVVTYFVREEHTALTSNAQVLESLDAILRDGKTTTLSGGQLVTRQVDRKELAAQLRTRGEERETRMADLARQLRMHGAAGRARTATIGAGDELEIQDERTQVTRMEREAADLVFGSFFRSSPDETPSQVLDPHNEIQVVLVQGSIGADEDSTRKRLRGIDSDDLPIDAISVGHYAGVQPQMAVLALDRAISAELPGGAWAEAVRHELQEASSKDTGSQDLDRYLLLTRFIDRGLISGQLGQPFFLPDPRNPGQRLIALAGMGEVGRCGNPELIVVVRELCWSLGRLGRKHLATVLIGSGNGNLAVRDAIESWFCGLRSALRETGEHNPGQLRRITFVESDELKLRQIQDAIRSVATEIEASCRFKVTFTEVPESRLIKLEEEGLEREAARARERVERARAKGRTQDHADRVPTRLTVGLDLDQHNPRRANYRFAALTAEASVPERDINLDPTLVERANNELAGESQRELQRERGEFLGRLLIPHDLRSHLRTSAPLVLSLDATTARIHWEMVAQPDSPRLPNDPDNGFFLGISRSLTRQLRTTFAGPPEPLPPQNRTLRVLIVADPAEDAHLPGAEAEGLAVLGLFESFNTVAAAQGVPNRVEVVPLLGPYQARRTDVLRELSVRSYDVVHYAGHAFYNAATPSLSGWLFSNGEVLSAHELRRIDRVPGFVFSNACESGITPDRAGKRTAELAPSFAEAFFERGVKNFVCTAWPVDDLAAQLFALALYRQLLGLELPSGDTIDNARGPRFEPMHIAMRSARREVAGSRSGQQTWGAYQHYGNPFHRFFVSTPLRGGASTD